MNGIQSAFFRRVAYSYVRKWVYPGASVLACVVLVAASPVFGQNEATQQSQTVQLSVPVEAGGEGQALVDSAFAVVNRWSRPADSLTVSRQSGGTQRSPSELRQALIGRFGLGIGSSSHMFINYRLRLGQGTFEERITGLQYIFSPPSGEDVDMLFLDPAKQAWVRRLLRSESGLTSSISVTRSFSHQLAFLRLLESTNAKIQRIGGEQASEEEKTLLIDRVRQAALRSR